MNYSFFLDETGDHGLSYVDKNFPLFLLCGCVIREDALKDIEKKINSFKQKYFKTVEVILHSRDIRKCEGVFQILFDLNLKAEFYRDINQILGEGQYCLIGSGVQKEEHIKKYGKGAKDPYSLSLSFVLKDLFSIWIKSMNEQRLRYLQRKEVKEKIKCCFPILTLSWIEEPFMCNRIDLRTR